MSGTVSIGAFITCISEGEMVEKTDVIKALNKISKMVSDGNTSGIFEFETPHTHCGEQDCAIYQVTWHVR